MRATSSDARRRDTARSSDDRCRDRCRARASASGRERRQTDSHISRAPSRRRATRRDGVDSLNVGIRRISRRLRGEGIRTSPRSRSAASADGSARASNAFAATRPRLATRARRRDARARGERTRGPAPAGPAKTRDSGRSSASARAETQNEVLKIDSRRYDGAFFTLQRARAIHAMLTTVTSRRVARETTISTARETTASRRSPTAVSAERTSTGRLYKQNTPPRELRGDTGGRAS